MRANPYEQYLTDEATGQPYLNEKFYVWKQGYDAGEIDGKKHGYKRAIKAAVDAINKEGGYIES